MDLVVKFFIITALVIGVGLLLALPTMWLWNALMPDIFSLPTITFWQALGLNILSGVFFKSTSYSSK